MFFVRSRRGVPISPLVNYVRMVVVLCLTVVLTWYARQKYNNPFQLRPEFFLETGDISTLVFYQKSTRKSSDSTIVSLFSNERAGIQTVLLDQESFIFIREDSQNDTLSYYAHNGWKYVTRVWGTSISSEMMSMVVVHSGVSLQGTLPGEYDILITDAQDQERLKEERFFFRPRITVWITENPSEHLPAENILVCTQEERYFFEHGKRGSITWRKESVFFE